MKRQISFILIFATVFCALFIGSSAVCFGVDSTTSQSGYTAVTQSGEPENDESEPLSEANIKKDNRIIYILGVAAGGVLIICGVIGIIQKAVKKQ